MQPCTTLATWVRIQLLHLWVYGVKVSAVSYVDNFGAEYPWGRQLLTRTFPMLPTRTHAHPRGLVDSSSPLATLALSPYQADSTR